MTDALAVDAKEMTDTEVLEDFASKEYKYGFVTNIETDNAPPGLDESTIAFISNKKGEPEWLLEWRLKAVRTPLSSLPSAAAPAASLIVEDAQRAPERKGYT